MGVSKNRGTPKSSILIVFSIINHQFSGPTPIFGNTQVFHVPSPRHLFLLNVGAGFQGRHGAGAGDFFGRDGCIQDVKLQILVKSIEHISKALWHYHYTDW